LGDNDSFDSVEFDDLDKEEEEEDGPKPADLVQEALLASFAMMLQERNIARALDEGDVALLGRVTDISRERVSTEEAARLLMLTER
jgi:hypothetical protein